MALRLDIGTCLSAQMAVQPGDVIGLVRGKQVESRSIALNVSSSEILVAGAVILLDDPTMQTARAQAGEAQQQGKILLIHTIHPAIAAALCNRVILLAEGGNCAEVSIAALQAALRHEHYQIRVRGQLSNDWSDWFGGEVIAVSEGETLLEGVFPDQSALYGLLERLHALHLPLLNVERLEPEPRHLLKLLFSG